MKFLKGLIVTILAVVIVNAIGRQIDGMGVATILKLESRVNRLNEENAAWREAARPVFQSRGTYDITDHATPGDLKCYTDRKCAVVWQEHSLVN